MVWSIHSHICSFLHQFCIRWVLINFFVKLLKLLTFAFGTMLQLVVSCMHIVLLTLLYATWIFLDAILKLLEGTCCPLCDWHWFDMVDVALLLAIWGVMYYSALVHYCLTLWSNVYVGSKGPLWWSFMNTNWPIFRSEALVTFLLLLVSVNLFSVSNLACRPYRKNNSGTSFVRARLGIWETS